MVYVDVITLLKFACISIIYSRLQDLAESRDMETYDKRLNAMVISTEWLHDTSTSKWLERKWLPHIKVFLKYNIIHYFLAGSIQGSS
jgi:hypothetical protein